MNLAIRRCRIFTNCCTLALSVVFLSVLHAQSTRLGIFEGQSDVGAVTPPGAAVYDRATGAYTLTSAGANLGAQPTLSTSSGRKPPATSRSPPASFSPIPSASIVPIARPSSSFVKTSMLTLPTLTPHRMAQAKLRSRIGALPVESQRVSSWTAPLPSDSVSKNAATPSPCILPRLPTPRSTR